MAGAKDIRAGRAFVEIYADKTKLTRTLKTISADLKAFGTGVSSLGTKFMALGTGIVAPLLAATKHFMTIGDQLDKMSARTGVSTNALSELGFAAEQSGANIETIEKSIRKMQKTIADAATGEKTYVDALKAVGLSYQQLAGLSPEKQFEAIASGINAIDDPTMKAAAAVEIFGRSGTQLIPMLGDMKALREEAKRLGLSIGPEQAKAAAALTDAWNRVKRSFGAIAVAIGSELAPMLTGLAETAKRYIGIVRDWISKHGQLVETILRVGAAAVILGAALKVVGIGLTLLAAHPVVAVFVGLGIAVTALTGGFSALVRETERYNTTARDSLSAGDEQRRTAQGQIEALEELSKQQAKGANVSVEAKSIIDMLTGAYGDLGLSVDKTTGKILGLENAQVKLNESMRKEALEEVKIAHAETLAEIERHQKKLDEASAAPNSGNAFGVILKDIFMGNDADAELEKIIALQSKLKTLSHRWGRLAEGDNAAALGDAPAAPGGGDRIANEVANIEEMEKQERELHRLKLQGIQDEYDRKIALIDEEYDYRIKKAEEAGQEVFNLEAMRNEEIAQLFDEQAKKKAEEEKRAAEEQAKLDEEKTRNRQSVEDEIARAEIEANLKGHDKAMALLEIERQQAIRDLAEGVDADRINRLYDLKAAALNGEDLSLAAGSRQSTRGTFSASAVAGLGMGGIQERIAKAVENMAKRREEEVLKRMLIRLDQMAGKGMAT